MNSATRVSRRRRVAAVLAAVAVAATACATADAPASNEPVRQWGYLTLPTGERMRYSVVLPEASGQFPVLVEYDGYGAGTEPSIGMPWVREGYAVVGLNVPGTGCSTGDNHMFGAEIGAAGAFAVEWAAQQPWSTGRVGMIGYSYSGYNQLWTAVERPRGLTAITPSKNVGDPYRDVAYPGGIRNSGFPTAWWGEFPEIWRSAAQRAAELDGDTDCAATVADNIAKAQRPEFDFGRRITETTEHEGFYVDKSARSRTDRIDVPVLATQSWQDEQVGTRMGYVEETVRPDLLWTVSSNGDHHTDLTSADIRELMRRFLARYVKDEDNGFEREPRVRVLQEMQVAGSGEEQTTTPTAVAEFGLPVPVTPLRLWFGPDGTLTQAPPAPDTPGAEYRYPVSGSVVNDPPAEGWSPDTAPDGRRAFTTAALPQALSFLGAGSVDLWLSSTAPDTDVQVTLSEVRPDGKEMFVQRGWLRASERRLDPALSTELRPWGDFGPGAAEPLTPGEPALLRVELPKFAHTFRPGSSIRITIDAPARTGFWEFDRITTEAVNTVLLDAAHPSSVVLGYTPYPHAPALPSCATTLRQPCRDNTTPIPPGEGPRPPA
ncbi:CocE/NonD family hydrolase [Nocardia farcinica]|uniref:CocE/NonD family hydrolase n=1 Tax=Nocardia farcinica TaxID=37329 RepID=UPI0018931F49|nr:CocE/NonD family hydrolase [Nocardia farcinica]MBF6253338.1 CocE/NonD family hydrolase [Nocardia farcinica]